MLHRSSVYHDFLSLWFRHHSLSLFTPYFNCYNSFRVLLTFFRVKFTKDNVKLLTAIVSVVWHILMKSLPFICKHVRFPVISRNSKNSVTMGNKDFRTKTSGWMKTFQINDIFPHVSADIWEVSHLAQISRFLRDDNNIFHKQSVLIVYSFRIELCFWL